jgi:hypothetical protein
MITVIHRRLNAGFVFSGLRGAIVLVGAALSLHDARGIHRRLNATKARRHEEALSTPGFVFSSLRGAIVLVGAALSLHDARAQAAYTTWSDYSGRTD